MGRRAGAGAVGPSLVPVGVSYVESTFQKTGRQGRGARRSRRASNSATMPSYVCLSFEKYLFRCVDVRSFNECFGLCYGVELRLPRSNPPRSTPPPVSPSPSPQPSPLSPPTPLHPPSLPPVSHHRRKSNVQHCLITRKRKLRFGIFLIRQNIRNKIKDLRLAVVAYRALSSFSYS